MMRYQTQVYRVAELAGRSRAVPRHSGRRHLSNDSGQSSSSRAGRTSTNGQATRTAANAKHPTSPVTWKGLAVTVAMGTAGLAYYGYERERRIREISTPRTVGKASIGGPFILIDEHGKEFTDDHLLGHWSLVYFGFTMCPDICPEELTKLAEALEKVEKRGHKVSAKTEGSIMPVFISIDPERDSPKRAAEYARGFHSAFVGLGGSLEQVTDAAKKYRVYFSKDETPGDDYLVDHSIITYLMDPNGEFQEFYGKTASAVEIASRIEASILSWKP